MAERNGTRLTPNIGAFNSEADAIQRELDCTRESMDRTLDELQRRLSPRQIAHDTFDNIKEASNNMYRASINSIKDHPIPVAIAGFSIAMLLGSVIVERSRNRRRNGHPIDPTYGEAGTPMSDPSASASCSARSIVDTASKAVTNAAHAAKESVSKVTDSMAQHARDLSHNVNEKRKIVQHQVRHGYDVTRDSVEHSFHDHPLLIGAGVFAAGLALGAVLPSTRKEDQWMGEYRDDLVDNARDRVTRTARTAADAATHAARRESLDDPTRLIDDVRSSTGDASPSRIGAEVGRRAGVVVGETIQAVKQEVTTGSSRSEKDLATSPGNSGRPLKGGF